MREQARTCTCHGREGATCHAQPHCVLCACAEERPGFYGSVVEFYPLVSTLGAVSALDAADLAALSTLSCPTLPAVLPDES